MVPLVAAGAAPVVVGGAAPVVAGGVAPVVAGGVVPVVARIAAAPLPVVVELGLLEVGVDGTVVNGVGSGGRGLDNTLAIRPSMPASDWLRYLYQVDKLSIHSFFGVAYFGSFPASATARAYASIIRSMT